MGRVKLAFDFDGVLNRLPKPFEIFMRYTKPDDVINRAGFGTLKIAVVIFVVHLPLNLNGKILDRIPRDSIIISGRTTKRKKAEDLLRKLGFKNICFRDTLQVSDTEFKIKMCKKLGVDILVDDRIYTLEKIKANGIIGVDVREWVKRLVL